VLPSAAQTKPIVLSDVTVCKTPGTNDAATYSPTLPWVGGGALPAQAPPTPQTLCEAPTAIDEDGNLRASFAAGDIPNNQTPATSGRTNEGQTVLTNGMNVGGRGGSPAAPGALAPGAMTLSVQAGQGLRLPIVNAATTRFMRLRLTTSTGALVPLVRVGGEGGLLSDAVVEGGIPGGFDTQYGVGEILLPPGARADVVAAIPPAATGVLTLWTQDFSRTGQGFSNIPTVPVMHLAISGTAPQNYLINAGTPLRSATGDPVATLGPATGTLLNPATFAPPKVGLASQNVQLTQTGTALGVNNTFGTHDIDGDYTGAPHLASTRYARAGDTLELTVTNTTSAHHPFHLHGFSIQPLDLTRPANPTFTWPYREFRDNVDVPALYTLRFRIKLDDRALPDGTTPGGSSGRWVFHCHIFFHATNGMLGELVVVPAANGNEKPYVNANAARVAVTQGQTATMQGTYKDPEGDPVTLSASSGTVTDTGNGTWSWSRSTTAADTSGLVFVTASDAGGRKDQAAFSLEIAASAATLTLTPATATNPVGSSHAVAATLANASPAARRKILFAVTGANTAAGAVATSASGVASFAYTGNNLGSDAIQACLDADDSGVCDAGELTATAAKIWTFSLPAVDNFKCYTVTPPRLRPRSVTLKDQFAQRRSRAYARRTLCNPASRNGAKIRSAKAHLTCYATRDSGAAVKGRKVRISNQFGSRVISVLKPQSLCVPSLERLVPRKGRARRPAGPDPTRLVDHFRCYSVRVVATTKTVKLRDQFATTTTRTVRLTQLCNPVRKRHGRRTSAIRRAAAHLVCYSIRDSRRFGARRVIVRNQFESARLRATRVQTLCVPSRTQKP
jgi:FtsP/CotA-like multicopper oxidase with cupredoxin domain